MITSQLFEAYLSCSMKCFLRSVGTEESGNPIATWFENRNASHLSKSIRLVDGADADCVVAAGQLQACIHGVQRTCRAGRVCRFRCVSFAAKSLPASTAW